MKQVRSEKISSRPPDAVKSDLVALMAPPLARWNYRLISDSDRLIVFERSYRPWWTVICAVLLFPIGLLALLVTNEAVITVNLAEVDGGSAILIQGDADAKVASAIEGMIV